jgi:hypothetical protein
MSWVWHNSTKLSNFFNHSNYSQCISCDIRNIFDHTDSVRSFGLTGSGLDGQRCTQSGIVVGRTSETNR